MAILLGLFSWSGVGWIIAALGTLAGIVLALNPNATDVLVAKACLTVAAIVFTVKAAMTLATSPDSFWVRSSVAVLIFSVASIGWIEGWRWLTLKEHRLISLAKPGISALAVDTRLEPSNQITELHAAASSSERTVNNRQRSTQPVTSSPSVSTMPVVRDTNPSPVLAQSGTAQPEPATPKTTSAQGDAAFRLGRGEDVVIRDSLFLGFDRALDIGNLQRSVYERNLITSPGTDFVEPFIKQRTEILETEWTNLSDEDRAGRRLKLNELAAKLRAAKPDARVEIAEELLRMR